MKPKIYRGLVFADKLAVCIIGVGCQGEPCIAANLDPLPSQRIRNHSPDGFNWGYSGSGPAQLALAILLDHTNSAMCASTLYQHFKRDVISRMPQRQGWELTATEVQYWIDHGNADGYFTRKFDGHE